MSGVRGMPVAEAVRVLHAARGEELVVTTMSPGREWMGLEAEHPLDFHYIPSSMGQATSVGLGLALARPDRRVLVLNGDGSLLMNLGTLVTIRAAGASNVTVFVFDNGAYEVTGANPTAGGVIVADGGEVDFAGMAEAAGFPSVFRFEELEAWRGEVGAVLAAPGPVLCHLRVEVGSGKPVPLGSRPAAERAAAFRAAVAELR